MEFYINVVAIKKGNKKSKRDEGERGGGEWKMVRNKRKKISIG